MQSGDLVSVVQFNGYRFEDVFLSQALRIQNFIELGAWFARYFGVPVSRQRFTTTPFLTAYRRSMSITGI